jgi:Fic family protein
MVIRHSNQRIVSFVWQAMHITTDSYFDQYRRHLTGDLAGAMANLNGIELTEKSFTFYTSVAVISSSRIEGEQMEVDSYVKYKTQDIEYLPELVEKPNDLFKAYRFARQNTLTAKNFLQSHILLSRHLLPKRWRGITRKNEMLVLEHNTGNIQFEAAPYRVLDEEVRKLWEDIDHLATIQLSVEEVLYYASFIHLAFVSIHPFNDGNGRAGRLLEKWFLAAKLGERAWYLPSEKYYYADVNDYYKNLNRLGVFYEQLDYSKAMPFLLMLPEAVK